MIPFGDKSKYLLLFPCTMTRGLPVIFATYRIVTAILRHNVAVRPSTAAKGGFFVR